MILISGNNMFKIQELILFEDGSTLAASIKDWVQDDKMLKDHHVDYSKFYLDQLVIEDLGFFVDQMV